MEVDASDPDRDQFRRSHAGEEQSVQEREVWVVRAGLVNSTDFPAPGAEVAKDFIAFFLGERRRSRNDLFGPAHFWKWKRHREVILLRVTHHGTERSQSSARFRRTARAATCFAHLSPAQYEVPDSDIHQKGLRKSSFTNVDSEPLGRASSKPFALLGLTSPLQRLGEDLRKSIKARQLLLPCLPTLGRIYERNRFRPFNNWEDFAPRLGP